MTRSKLVCRPAEPKEHVGTAGAEEIQQILTKDDGEGSTTIERIVAKLHDRFLGRFEHNDGKTATIIHIVCQIWCAASLTPL